MTGTNGAIASTMLIWQRRANEILDESDREKQVALYKALPKEIRAEVGDLVRKQMLAEQDYRTYGWRTVWQNNNRQR